MGITTAPVSTPVQGHFTGVPARKPSTVRNETASAGTNPPARNIDAGLYRLSVEQRALAARFEQTLASSAESGAAFASQQLEFSFFEETRIEELAWFRERTGATGENLPAGQRASYSSISRQVATRFEFSASVSASSLNGFANLGDLFAEDGELIDRLLAFTEKLLKRTDELFNDIFGGFDGSVAADPAVQFAELFEQLAAKLFNEVFRPGNTAPEGSGSTSAAGVQLEFKFEFSFSASFTQEEVVVQQSDPVILDLDGDGFELTGYENGARFDILGNGKTQTTAFVTGGDAFLAFDRNGDGKVNSGRELFGDQYGAANGYEELRKLDSNGDNVIDHRDADFNKLLLFKDDGDGVTEEGELVSLRQAGIESISLNYSNVHERTSGGNHLAQIASFRRTDGTLGRAGDAVLNYIA